MEDVDASVRTRTPGLLRAAYPLTGDRHAAEDLAQAALGRTALRWRRIERAGGADAYVRTALRRLHADDWDLLPESYGEVWLDDGRLIGAGGGDEADMLTVRTLDGDVVERRALPYPVLRADLEVRPAS